VGKYLAKPKLGNLAEGR